ncbi:MAG: transposase, partial [candidate division KSB1 bacterium]|nr:transposase [candidate division KSB1 bacterium]
KHLASYFGLHPELKLSGDGVWRICMSKKGRAEPRAILFMVTLAAICHNPLIRELYEKKINAGIHKMAAIGICMHKILRIVYGMLKHKTPFDPNIDKINQAKSQNHTQKPKRDKNRRLQDFDANAPISRRQNNKRKELLKTTNRSELKTVKTRPQPERMSGGWVKLSALLSIYPQLIEKNS